MNQIVQPNPQVNIVLVNDKKMRALKRKFSGKGEVGDVLAFSMKEELEQGIFLLGEIVVNQEQARRQAKEYGVSEEEEMARLITHGALHLLGYRDETEEERRGMEEVQERIVTEVQSVKHKV